MKYKRILSLDPSGSFYEGKGTTGWCLLNCETTEFITSGSISALDYTCMEEYWDAHMKLIEKYLDKDTILVCEDYLLYADKAAAQTNSRMETPKVIGCIQLECWRKGWAYYMQTASEVKRRWTNEILLYKGYIKSYRRSFIVTTGELEHWTHHSLDAVRHAIHYATFRNKGDL